MKTRPNFFKRMVRAFRPVKVVSPWPPMGDEREVTARYARGNILLQTGRIQTRAEYEAQKRRVLSHVF